MPDSYIDYLLGPCSDEETPAPKAAAPKAAASKPAVPKTVPKAAVPKIRPALQARKWVATLRDLRGWTCRFERTCLPKTPGF